ncbi:hypothetical protein HZS_4897, partial [Henneguya salminicola]
MEELENEDENITPVKSLNENQQNISELKHPLIQKLIPNADKKMEKYRVFRFMVAASVVLVVLFLLTYSGYLLTIQYLLSIANKYNVKLLQENQIFFEIDVKKYRFNATCSFKSQSVHCISENLKTLKENGVTDIILKNIFESNYELSDEFSDLNSFKALITLAQYLNIGIYVEITRLTKNIIKSRAQETNEIKNVRNEISFIMSDNSTCIDTYRQDVMAIIQEYSPLGVNGFVITDVPCCVMYPHYFENGIQFLKNIETCNFESIYEMRKLARKEGKPSALIYRPKPIIYKAMMNKISNYNYTYFDGIINYIFVEKKGNIDIPAIAEAKFNVSPQELWELRIDQDKFMNISMNLYQSILAFFTGSAVYTTSDNLYKSHSSGKKDFYLQRYMMDLKNISLLAKLKNIIKNICFNNSFSSYVPEYSNDRLFLVLYKLDSEEVSHCALVINFGDTRTDINMKVHFGDTKTKLATAMIALTINNDGLKLNEPTSAKQTITIEPKTGL